MGKFGVKKYLSWEEARERIFVAGEIWGKNITRGWYLQYTLSIVLPFQKLIGYSQGLRRLPLRDRRIYLASRFRWIYSLRLGLDWNYFHEEAMESMG